MAERKQEIQKDFVIEIRVVADGDGIRMIPAIFEVRETAHFYDTIDQSRRFPKKSQGVAKIPDESYNLKHPRVKLQLWKYYRITHRDLKRKTDELKRTAMANLMNHHQQMHRNLARISRGLTYGFVENFEN